MCNNPSFLVKMAWPLYHLWRHSSVTWHDPVNFFTKSCANAAPIGYYKFQHDATHISACLAKKKNSGRGIASTPLPPGRGLSSSKPPSKKLSLGGQVPWDGFEHVQEWSWIVLAFIWRRVVAKGWLTIPKIVLRREAHIFDKFRYLWNVREDPETRGKSSSWRKQTRRKANNRNWGAQLEISFRKCPSRVKAFMLRKTNGVKIALFSYKFSSNVWMDGMTESEPTLSSACFAGPGPYRPIGKFRVIGRI